MEFPWIFFLLYPLLIGFPVVTSSDQDAKPERRFRRDYYGPSYRNNSVNYQDDNRYDNSYDGEGQDSYDDDQDGYDDSYRDNYDNSYSDRYSSYGNRRYKHRRRHSTTPTTTTTATTTTTTIPANACISPPGETVTCSADECKQTYLAQQPIRVFVTPQGSLTSCLVDGTQVALIDACTISSAYAPDGVEFSQLNYFVDCTPSDSSFSNCFAVSDNYVVVQTSGSTTCSTTILQQTHLRCILGVDDNYNQFLAVAFFTLTIAPAQCPSQVPIGVNR